MHDVIGNAGMLRGWISVWTMQMLWLFAGLTLAVGVTAMIELMITGRSQPVGLRQVSRTAPPDA